MTLHGLESLATPISSQALAKGLSLVHHGPDKLISALISSQGEPWQSHHTYLTPLNTPRHTLSQDQLLACAVLTTPDVLPTLPKGVTALQIERKDFRSALLALCRLFDSDSNNPLEPKIHPTAVLSEEAHIEKQVSIGPYVVIEKGVHVQSGTQIAAHTVLEKGVRVGRDCRIGPRCVLHADTQLGHRVRLDAGCTLGGRSFGIAYDTQGYTNLPPNAPQAIPHLYPLIVEDDVMIGSHTFIERGLLKSTRIGQHSKLGGMGVIGHGVTIGKRVVMATQFAVGGSCEIGDDVLFGGCVRVYDHVTLPEKTTFLGGTVVRKGSLYAPGGVYGSVTPTTTREGWLRITKFLLRIARTPSS